jgi:hypothetical protein
MPPAASPGMTPVNINLVWLRRPRHKRGCRRCVVALLLFGLPFAVWPTHLLAAEFVLLPLP